MLIKKFKGNNFIIKFFEENQSVGVDCPDGFIYLNEEKIGDVFFIFLAGCMRNSTFPEEIDKRAERLIDIWEGESVNNV